MKSRSESARGRKATLIAAACLTMLVVFGLCLNLSGVYARNAAEKELRDDLYAQYPNKVKKKNAAASAQENLADYLGSLIASLVKSETTALNSVRQTAVTTDENGDEAIKNNAKYNRYTEKMAVYERAGDRITADLKALFDARAQADISARIAQAEAEKAVLSRQSNNIDALARDVSASADALAAAADEDAVKAAQDAEKAAAKALAKAEKAVEDDVFDAKVAVLQSMAEQFPEIGLWQRITLLFGSTTLCVIEALFSVELLITAMKSRHIGKTLGKFVLYDVLIALTAFTVIPFLWMISSSLKLDKDVFVYPMKWIPEIFHWENYKKIWTEVALATYFKNTSFIAVVVTFMQLLTSSFAAYAFAKMRFRGRDILFLCYIGTIAVPWQVYMLPQFILLSRVFGLYNTPWALIVLQSFSAFGVFLMRQFYLGIPNDLNEAARIDGLSEYGIWARIMLPLSKPAIATLIIFTFVGTWNDYMGPLIYLTRDEVKTIQVGLQRFIQQNSSDYHLIMATSVCSLVPVTVVFLFLQRYFIEGIATSGIKG